MQQMVVGEKVKDMIIHLTSDCQLDCTHCYVPHEKDKKELTIEDLEWVAKTFDIRNVMLMGGEPLMYPYLKEAIDLFKNVTISTNGLALAGNDKEQFIDLFKKKGRENFSAQLSIEGLENETNTIRGDGVWQKVMMSTKLLLDNDIRCYLRIGYHKGNINSIPKIIKDICAPMNVPLILVPRTDLSPLDIGQQIWLFDMIMEHNNKYQNYNDEKRIICLIAQPHFMQWLGQEGRCEAGSERLNITYNREITPCQFDWHHIIGNIGDELSFINNNRTDFLDRYKKIHSSCSFCEHASVCKSSCYVAQSHFGCPLKQNFTLGNYIKINKVDVGSIQTQIMGMKDLLRGSLVC